MNSATSPALEYSANPVKVSLPAYIPELDGLRAFSIILVLISHVGFERLVPGIFGVTVFFFISGFLITRQLLAELAARDTINLTGFYIRRILRLYPALIVMVAITTLVFEMVDVRVAFSDVAAALLYYANYWEMSRSITPVGESPFLFGILWSLAVEEHYYLVFPLLFVLFGKRRGWFCVILLSLIVLSTCWRVHLAILCHADSAACLGGVPWVRIDHGTDTRIDSILYGALLAVWLATPRGAASLRLLASAPVFVLGACLLVGSLLYRDDLFRDTLRFSVQGVGLFLCVPALLFSSRLSWVRGIVASKPAITVGRLSYSLYLWHMVPLHLLAVLAPSVWADMAGSGAVPHWTAFALVVPMGVIWFGLAIASYRLVERPMVALRRRFGSHTVEESGLARSQGPSNA